ncbi:hypothetical protein NECID01_2133 [Nematocida sp. AWRm77]|nr:hypothetical protein NECID01_2133 [Nematocida sp. AWRm77]
MIRVPEERRVEVTERESILFQELLEYNTETGAGITFRVAGGWVRDKVMGKPCEDIDIAIDKTSGAVFAKGFLEYLKRRNEDVGGFHVIPYNHEKAKHLETASLRYCNYEIDFVALRSEEYADTRIPTVRVGTPKEDAERRDLTINALFYNINTGEIEDYTGRGLRDIEERLVQTPLPPRETFLDDPLRILRALRFASRLAFSLSEEILSALKEFALVERLREIVSRERIGQEVYKLLQAPGYYIGLSVMLEYGIIKAVCTQIAEVSQEQTQKYFAVHREIEEQAETCTLGCHPYKDVLPSERYLVRLFSILQHGLRQKSVGKMSVVAWTVHNDLKFTKADREKADRVGSSLVLLSSLASGLEERAPEEERKHKMIKLALKAQGLLPLVLSIYDIIQRSQGECSASLLEECSVSAVYRDMHAYKYTTIWAHKHRIDYGSLMEELEAEISIPKHAKKECIEKMVELSLLYSTTDKNELLHYIKSHLKLEEKRD